MRPFTILVAALLCAGTLAGCVGNAAEKDPATENLDAADLPETGLSGDAATDAAAQLKVLAPLTSTLELSAPAWVAPGTTVPVSATAPANAKGTVTYTWAIGALPGTAAVTDLKLDTKTIAAGASKILTFTTAGVYRMHCHPHPAMKHNVTVVEGLAPSDLTVAIVDGDSPAEYRFVPENVVVGVGSKVTYLNKGALAHTATAEAQEPPLKKLALDQASGDVKLEGNGWQRIVVLMRDTEGRIGSAESRVYVAPLPSFAGHSMKFDFKAAPPAQPAEAADPPQTSPFVLDYLLLANVTMKATIAPGGTALPDPAGSAAEVEVHIFRQGETQDTMTCDAGASCEQAGKFPAGSYTIKVVAKTGAAISGTVTVAGVYEAVPPEPAMAAAPAAGGHGDHAGH